MLTVKQQKSLLERTTYTLTTNGQVLYGRPIGWDADHRGFGAVVVFPSGHRSFFGVHPYTLQVVDLGIPPSPPKRRNRRPKPVFGALMLPRWR
jgi:hypothetical protein